ncbi:hypothetical protein OS493_007158 [Desmophyllum pertusum]|uniref:HECT domain-containing protein n=1 Tax=Desmophyllum pertusum TaxID=174260 RepID=A0A9W9ZFH2_9CNID|nr:hypothetical protein OS493_007158 [Desmophyllum pertusum]
MTDDDIRILGIEAIGDLVRLRVMCREYEYEEGNAAGHGSSNSGPSVASTSGTSDRPSANSIREERMRLFNPRGARSQSKKKKTPQGRTWTVQFVCLADMYQCKIPSATLKQTLHKAGLGAKKIKLTLDDDEVSVHQKLISSEKDDLGDVKGFPQLRDGGGFEMLHCLPNCRDLTPLKCSWAAKEMRSNLGGQSKIYLRPIQKDLSTKSLVPQNSCEVKEMCMSCKKEFPMSELRTHSFYMCLAGLNSGSDSEGENNTTAHSHGSATITVPDADSLQPETAESTQPEEQLDATPQVPDQSIPEEKEDTVDDAISSVLHYCRANNINNPVEILRCLQKAIVTGRKLELESDSEVLEGETNYINVDRTNLLDGTFEEVAALENLRLTLEVSFYGEVARDYVGVIMGLSIVQNGKIPQFFSEDQLQEIFHGTSVIPAVANLQKGLSELGIYQVCKQLPILLHIFRPNTAAALTIKKVTNLLTPTFSEDGSNQRRYEGIVYGAFCRYLREVQSGRRKGLTLAHILWFTTGSDEEPLLGFKLHPSLLFHGVDTSFLPLANTCINAIRLPRPSLHVSIPSDDTLFELYDCAFLTNYFGNN